MIVTDLEYALENRLVRKLDLLIDRCTRTKPVRDAWLICEGGEGEGKTNASIAIAYYAKCKTGRDIHLFFKMEPMMNFAKRTEQKIIILDEPSLDALRGDGNSILNRNFKRFMSTCRKKQHLVITNLTRFYIFSDYLVVDRCLGLIHLYSRKEIEPGRFIYIKKKKLEALYRAWNSKGLREYRQNKNFGGTFPEVMERYFDKMGIWINDKPNCTLKEYNKLKDEGIEGIGEAKDVIGKKDQGYLLSLNRLRKGVADLIKKYQLNQMEASQVLGVSPPRFREWARIDLNSPFSLGNQGFKADTEAFSITLGGLDQEKTETKSDNKEIIPITN